MLPDATSTRFPDRPIRPLPQRRKLDDRPQLGPGFSLLVDSQVATQHADYDEISYPYCETSHTPLTETALAKQRNRLDAIDDQQPCERADSIARAPTFSEQNDGYDALENANNKKKRKIPSLIDVPREDPSLYSDQISQVATETRAHALQPPTIHNRQSSDKDGIKSIHGRRKPLRARPDISNMLSKLKIEREALSNNDKTASNTNIYNPEGQENARISGTEGLSSPSFTFTCNALNQDRPLWPEQPVSSERSSSTNSIASPVTFDASTDDRSTRPRNRRPLSEVLYAAAHYRRRMVELKHSRSPPKEEDVWICDFCEYESIFGTPPRALVRIYELKDRRLRQDEQERRRLLQKAKTKNWNNRKHNTTKGANIQRPPQSDLEVLEGGTEGIVITNTQTNADGVADFARRQTPLNSGIASPRGLEIPSGT